MQNFQTLVETDHPWKVGFKQDSINNNDRGSLVPGVVRKEQG